MLTLTNRAAISAALNNLDLDVDLRALLGRLAWRLYVEENQPGRGDIKIVVVQGGDSPKAINAAVGFHITGDDPKDPPTYEHLEDLGLWFELTYARAQQRLFVFVENTPATELGIHWLCLAHFWQDGDGEGR